MGQFFNQPDFATEAETALPVPRTLALQGIGFLDSACLYVGTGGDIILIAAGGDPNDSPAYAYFKNVPSGSILPVTADFILTSFKSTLTTAADFVALK
tara:strand:- start:341 stop:634 length:294 start_codon:yes stop_codon:yes gene_type:complete